ncbi:1,4-alpha-glucan-branching protein [Desulfosarcina ovata subsp. sediminis]|uniref:1,4-alpha-glucan-branching protein n=1 Tax=Desulfosarcina ovata subsp. sediminis TaxID=885957 RepID=A0A5K7ZND0_9BACT|nr:isoamylase early set domain-containing protein [Desulfosarcina ovata]BBO82691.1 1,4-alpha-glucan-branching protein [Desulfosarcina ovata subsp. sediminis]
MSIKKKYLKSKAVFKVTFKIAAEQAKSVKQAHVVGEFNGWSTTATPMRRMKNGSFSATVEIKPGQAYQFRYLLGRSQWENDPDADGIVPTHFNDAYNSLLKL